VRIVPALVLAAAIAACASSSDVGTLKTFERRQVAVERDTAIEASRVAAIQAYRKFLDAAPKDRSRPEAMRRVGDLQIEQAQEPNVDSADTRQYRDAIKVYEDLLRAYPRHEGNDLVLYQLAHAYDQIGDLPHALSTLDRLFAQYPNSVYRGEAAFRRGELLFSLGRYTDAQTAYESVLHSGDSPAFHERALYMHGWSLFKQLQLEHALHSFFAVLDRKLIGRDSDATLEEVAGLTRGERELVEDTFRVVSLSLANLKGAESIPAYFLPPQRHEYEFRVYQQLGELYMKQERVEDAALTFNAFARRYPTHVQAPILQSRVIEAYQQAGFGALALETKKEFVVRYGVDSEFRRVNDADVYDRVLPYVKTHLEELARHYHASAQKSKKSDDYQEAIRWYRAYLDSFPLDAKASAMRFLLAELLFENKRFADAAIEYEHTAYGYPRHDKSADAGYAALLAYAQQEKALKGQDGSTIQRKAIESALRFADANPKDARTAGVLTDTAEKLFAAHDQQAAITVAQRVLALDPPATADQRRTAWTVVAHVEFEQGAFDRAEQGYKEVLALTPEKSPNRAALTEKLAASVYKQGEQARSTGQLGVAAAQFLRVGKIVPNSPIRATAEYDAAAVMISQKDWNGAAKVLEDFRRDHPKHPLQAEIPGKLAVVYLESGQALKAAGEFETLASSKKDTGLSREALWQAAELYEKAGHEKNAASAYERYVREHARPLEPAIEARYRLAEMNRKQGQTAKRQAWSRELVEAEQKGGSERSDRTRYLGAVSAMVMAEPMEESYRSVRLVEPLKKNLKLKKEKMEQALRAYGIAAEYGVAEAATAATFRTAELYNDFGKAMLESQRPKGLNKDELEQYNVLLEEQAYPFEEKAIELHEINAQRVRHGLYDDWVKRSFTALGKLRPVRYAKVEKSEGVIRAPR
jgi:TolA-binding protein